MHSLDVGQAFRLAALRDDVRGAFNVAAQPPLGPDELAELLHARTVPVPARQPTRSAGDALLELLGGMRAGAGADTPPLRAADGLTGRLSELATGVGARDRR